MAVFHARMLQLRVKHLRLLDLIFETGSLRRAAAALHMTQPAATLLLQEAESALGLALFERHRRGAQPTPAARLLQPRLMRALNALAALQDDAASLASGERLSLRLGCLPRSMQTLMPQVLQALGERWPALQIVLRESTTDVLLRALDEGQLDCVVGRLIAEPMRGADGETFAYVRLYEDGLCFVCGPDHPLARRRRVALADLLGERWVLPPPGSMARRAFIDEFANAGLTPPSASIESAAFLSNLNLAAQGRMLAISPHSAARMHAARGEVRILPIALATALPPISLIWRKGEPMDEPMKALRELLEAALGQDAGGRRAKA